MTTSVSKASDVKLKPREGVLAVPVNSKVVRIVRPKSRSPRRVAPLTKMAV